MDEIRALLARAAELAADHRESLADRPVARAADPDVLRAGFGGALPETPSPPS